MNLRERVVEAPFTADDDVRKALAMENGSQRKSKYAYQ